ncbi:MAG: NAD(P)-dependent oxidoreductase [Pseudomonadota bacterium]|nr:NAD(P)-dependent oxidoreductase [Pseudomonadota bacterium]
MRTGFIGLGAMGLPMARNLSHAGLLTAIWNRSRDKAAALAEETGCRLAASPVDLTSDCEAIVLCVSADSDVLSVVDALTPGLGKNHIIIDCSTVARSTAIDAAKRVRARGADFLDCPVSGGTEGARLGTLAIMAGGAPETLERARPVLQVMGQRIVHMGDVGNGQATKAVNQVMAAGINQAVTEALAFGDALGLPMDALIDVIGGGAAGNWFLSHRGPTMVQGRFEPGFKLALHDKDLAICEAMAAQAGGELPTVHATRAHYQELMATGHGEQDISALYLLKRTLFSS